MKDRINWEDLALFAEVARAGNLTAAAERCGASVPTLSRRMHALEAGIGRTVLPMFVGEGRPGLVRVSDPIDALETEEWLVSHHEARHEPAIRAALDAVGDHLSARQG